MNDAMALVKSFVERYPPSAIYTSINVSPLAPLIEPPTPSPAPALATLSAQDQLSALKNMRSTRTKLLAPRPLVRTFSPAEIPDDFVPPCLTFTELLPLHQRLTTKTGRECLKQRQYLTWICNGYEGWLRRRRNKVTGRKTKFDTAQQ